MPILSLTISDVSGGDYTDEEVVPDGQEQVVDEDYDEDEAFTEIELDDQEDDEETKFDQIMSMDPIEL